MLGLSAFVRQSLKNNFCLHQMNFVSPLVKEMEKKHFLGKVNGTLSFCLSKFRTKRRTFLVTGQTHTHTQTNRHRTKPNFNIVGCNHQGCYYFF